MKKIYLFFGISLLSLFLLPGALTAQITVVPNRTAAILANKLVGAGIIMLNPTLTCAGVANGTFTGLSTLSFDSGIVLTSGQAIDAARPASFFASTGNGTAGDPQLTTLAGQTTYDACVLQFDFRPTGDTIKFDYVFGSEEYASYTCTAYNDVFGFFISGPGIAGARNIALVPGTAIPVCINSVNCGATGGGTIATCRALGAGSPFCAYYVNNSVGTTIAYDGLTKTLTAISPVTPCDTYHLKIGVADASDDILDSGVFLKAGSLKSISFSTSTMGVNPNDTGFGSQYCVRGCLPGMFIFHNTGSLTDSIIVHYTIGGTAVNGIDYTTILDSTIIHAGSCCDTVFIYGLTGVTGTKTVTLYVYAPFSCNGINTIMDSIQLTIYDSLHVHINTPDTTICLGDHVFINTSGSPNLTYSWSPATGLNSTTLLSPTATPTVTTTYTVTATLPFGGCPPGMAHIKITVLPPPGPPVITDPNPYCQGDPFIPFSITASGTVWWYPSAAGVGGTTTIPSVTTTVPGTYTYYFNQIIGSCISPIDSIKIVVIPAITADFTYVIHRGCNGDMVTFTSNTTNATTYSWNFGDGTPVVTTPNAVHTYAVQGIYTAVLTCTNVACTKQVSYQVDTKHGVSADFTPAPDTFCVINTAQTTTMTNISSSTVDTAVNIAVVSTANGTPPAMTMTFSWNFGDGTPADTTTNPTHSYSTAGIYPITLVTTDSIGCTATMTRTVIALRVDITSFHDSILCLRQPLPLNNVVTLYPDVSNNFTYSWTESAPNLDNLNVQVPNLSGFGIFTDILTATINPWGCYAIDTINVHSVLGQLLTNVSPDAVIPYGSSIQLNAGNELYYYWTPNDGSIDNPNINNPNATPTTTTQYTVYGMDQYGCVDSAFVTISIDSTMNEAIPSAFTPNGDGLNDVFRPVGIKYQRLVEFRVYNRWGRQVFYSHDIKDAWDGTYNGVPQDAGVYNYIVIVARPGSPNHEGVNIVYKGNVTLIR